MSMLKKSLIAAAVATLFSTAAFAQATPATPATPAHPHHRMLVVKKHHESKVQKRTEHHAKMVAKKKAKAAK